MAVSDAILKRLLALHPKIIDLSLDRMHRILAALGHPERALAPVIHVAGTNGKGSTIAYMQAAMEAAGLRVHTYSSPHLVRFHERIRLGAPGGGGPISDEELSELLERCEAANDGLPITFFEITTAAAMLAFSSHAADYLLLEVGLGGRLDATNVIDRPALSIITAVDLDHQQYLGDTIETIAAEKAGILKAGVQAVIARQDNDALAAIEARAVHTGTRLLVAGRDWQSFEQHGRLVYQDEDGLLDLPMPALAGRFQVDNAGTAIAALRALDDSRMDEKDISQAMTAVRWPARMQRITSGRLVDLCGSNAELWLDGGHNPAAGQAIAQSLADLSERVEKPVVLVLGMLNTKAAANYVAPFAGLVAGIVTLSIPDEENALSAEDLAAIARGQGIDAEPADSIEDAIATAAKAFETPRIVVCGSLYLAGHVLALNAGEKAGAVSGTSNKKG